MSGGSNGGFVLYGWKAWVALFFAYWIGAFLGIQIARIIIWPITGESPWWVPGV